jgi:hypothetical protein
MQVLLCRAKTADKDTLKDDLQGMIRFSNVF